MKAKDAYGDVLVELEGRLIHERNEKLVLRGKKRTWVCFEQKRPEQLDCLVGD